MTSPPIVLDTNVVLDLLVFDDVAAQPLKRGLAGGRLRWLATAAMRAELERVLGYRTIALRLARDRLAAADVLAGFDRHACLVAEAPPAGLRCADPDDQKFIDLAVQHQARLLSKDRAVLSMAKRLAALSVWASPAIEFVA